MNPKIKERYEYVLDMYVEKSNDIVNKLVLYYQKIFLIKPSVKWIFSFTIIGLSISFLLLLSSCNTSSFSSLSENEYKEESVSKIDPFYIKKESIKVEPIHKGSPTGSIWADAPQKSSYFTPYKPTKTGDVLTITIPPHLTYEPPQSMIPPLSNVKSDLKDTKDKEEDKNKENLQTQNLGQTTPLSPLPFQTESIKEFKMRIVSVDPSGFYYLQGSRSYNSDQSIPSTVKVLARIPKHELVSEKVEASKLSDIVVEEENKNGISTYAAPGWDKLVSRRVAGFVPDIDAQIQELERAREEIIQEQKNVQEFAKAIEAEKQRLLQDRQRMTQNLPAAPAQGQPLQPAQGQPAQGQPAQGQPAQGQPAQGQPAQGQPASPTQNPQTDGGG